MAVEIDGTSKGLLGAFAFFASASGIASLAYAIFLLLRYIGIEYNYGIFSLYATSILLITVGGLLILTVVLGIVGATKELQNVRLVTLVLLFVLFLVLAAVGIWGMIIHKTGRLQRSIDGDIRRFRNGKYEELPNDLKAKADYLNKKYNCCGAYDDYSTRAGDDNIPESCCIVPGCGKNPLDNSVQHFEKGCASVYFATKSITVYQVAILSLVAAGLALLALVFYAVVAQRARTGYAAVSRG